MDLGLGAFSALSWASQVIFLSNSNWTILFWDNLVGEMKTKFARIQEHVSGHQSQRPKIPKWATKPPIIQPVCEIWCVEDCGAASDGPLKRATQGRSSHPVPLEDWSTERKTCILPLLTCFFSVTTSWVFFGPVSCKTAALTGSTTFLGLETGRSINRSYQFLISLHTTVSFRVPKICLVGYLQELERLSSCCQRARSPLGEKHGQKGFIALFERRVFEKELFISWKYMVKLPNICSKCTWSHQSFPTRPLAANAGETSGFLGEFCSSQTKSCLLKGLAAGRV